MEKKSKDPSSKVSKKASPSRKYTTLLSILVVGGVLVIVGSLFKHTDFMPSSSHDSKSSKKHSSTKKIIPYKPTSAGYNMPELSSTDRGVNAILSASFIYWKPQQDEFTVGVSGPRPGAEQKVHDFKSNYRPGFKAGLGFNCPYDSWALYLEYTRLKTHQKTSQYSNSNHPITMSPWVGMTVQDQGLYDPSNPVLTNQISTSGVSNSWNFNFEMFDLLLSRSYYVGKKLIFNPSLGARGAIINQKLKVNYNYKITSTPSVSHTIYSHNKNNTQQIGPRFGLDMSWLIGSTFRFGGTIGAGLLYTQYYLSHTETLANVNHANVRYNPHAFRFNSDAALQFGWRIFSQRHRKYIDCFFKYEAVAFWQQNMMSGLTTINVDQGKKLQDGNLYLQGGTFNLAFSF